MASTLTQSFFLMTLIIGLIWVVPFICRKLHLPQIVGFILVGVLISTPWLDLAHNNATIRLLGQMGMLYIMFQSGSEIDINDFKRYRFHALLMGLLSFCLPFGVGVLIGRLTLHYSWTTSVLLGAMLGSHTLMTYPIVSRYSLQKNRAVNITIGATLWAVTLSLLVLAGVEASMQTPTTAQVAQMVGVALLLVAVILILFPMIAQWFFKRHQDPVSGFMLVMTMMVLSAYLAILAGLEGILGAFLCGVALNRRLPNHSPLVSRINFVGNSIFVPLFLISVGIMIDVEVFWSSWVTLLIAGLLIAGKLLGKSLSAWLSQVIFHFSGMERQLVFGLTHSAAAGTLAIATIGFQMGIFSNEILNASVLMILVLCTVSGFITEHAAKQLALQEEATMVSDHDQEQWLLTSIGKDLTESLTNLSHMATLRNVELAQSPDWTDVQRIVEHTSKSILVYHEHQPLNTINRLLVAVPRFAEKERDFITCFGLVRRLAGELGAKVIFYANSSTQQALKAMCNRPGKHLSAGFREMDNWEDVLIVAKEMGHNDLPILISTRKSTASYNPLFERLPMLIEQFFMDSGYMVVYPEQQTGGEDMDAFLMDNPQPSRAWKWVSRMKDLAVRIILPRQDA